MFNFENLKLKNKISLLAIFSIIVFSISFGGYVIFFLNQYINNSVLDNLQLNTWDVSNLIDFQLFVIVLRLVIQR